MNNNQKNKLQMYKKVGAKLKENLAKLAVVAKLPPAVQKFLGIIDIIEAKSSEAKDQTTGKLAVRDEAEDTLLELISRVSSSIVAYASEAKNTELHAKALIKKSELHRMRDTEIASTAKSILGLGQKYATEIEPYGVTAEVLTALEQAIEAFKTATENLGKGYSGKTGARLSMVEAFDQADVLLKEQIDNMMETVKKTDLQLYNEYQVARVIHDLGGSHTAKTAAQPAAVSAK